MNFLDRIRTYTPNCSIVPLIVFLSLFFLYFSLISFSTCAKLESWDVNKVIIIIFRINRSSKIYPCEGDAKY